MEAKPPAAYGLPATVQVGPFTFRIGPLAEERRLDSTHDFYGYTHQDDQVIELRDGLTLERAAQTFVHEIFHTIASERALDVLFSARTVEMFVEAMSTGLAAFMRDNPGVIAHVEGMATGAVQRNGPSRRVTRRRGT